MDRISIPSLNLSLPRLGFGCMRLIDDGQGNIETAPALKLLHTALEAGVDYFDTAYVYHGGKAEAFLGKNFFSALPREKFMLATKMPVSRIKEAAACEPLFCGQLKALRVEHIDFYLAHSLNKQSWQRFCGLGGADHLLRLKKEGRVRFLGFSFHGEPEDIGQIMDDFPWDFVQLQINYYDWPTQTQNAKLQYTEALKRGLPILVMEPVRGGSLANLPPAAVELLNNYEPYCNQARWAMRWVGSLPGVSMILSGMNSGQQLAENIDTFSGFRPLSQTEQQTITELTSFLHKQPHVGCTGCDYCKEACPQRILISTAFEAYNDYLRLKDKRILRNYRLFNPVERQSPQCTACAACVPHCPQGLDIPERLAALNSELASLG
ncbi:MAG: aldo/keto reductase [Clostridiales bacterium]|nr:aldo/keto reductase [Clostridiales bacterium]